MLAGFQTAVHYSPTFSVFVFKLLSINTNIKTTKYQLVIETNWKFPKTLYLITAMPGLETVMN